jgi:hypothetical protein
MAKKKHKQPKKVRERTIIMDVQLTYILKDDAVLDISLEELQATVGRVMSQDKAHTPWDDCHIKKLKVFDGGDE